MKNPKAATSGFLCPQVNSDSPQVTALRAILVNELIIVTSVIALCYVWGSVGQIGIYIIGVPMCLSILHCGGFPSSAQYSSIDTILSFAVLINDTVWKYKLLSWG